MFILVHLYPHEKQLDQLYHIVMRVLTINCDYICVTLCAVSFSLILINSFPKLAKLGHFPLASTMFVLHVKDTIYLSCHSLKFLHGNPPVSQRDFFFQFAYINFPFVL